MLERTAASLESCRFQRVLSKPGGGGSSKRCRKLQTGFWQHGASAIELSSTWPPVRRGKDKAEQDVSNQAGSPSQTGLLSSAFLLDFLYPSGTYALLRRLYPALPRPRDGGNKSVGAAAQPRTFASHTAAAAAATAAPASDVEDSSVVSSFGGSERKRHRSEGPQDRKHAPAGDVRATEDHDSESSTLDHGRSYSTAHEHEHEHENEHYQLHRKAYFNNLTDLLSRPEDALYHDVWDAYSKSVPHQKQHLRSAVVVYLSTSRSMVDISRAISLLRQIPAQSWNDEIQAAGILLHLRAGVMTAALDIFNTGLRSRHSGAGLQHLLEDALTKKEWTIVLKAWLENFSTRQKEQNSLVPEHNNNNEAQLSAMTSAIPDLAGLYFTFERYLETEAAGSVKAINLYKETRLGLEALRRWLAEQVLRQPCVPRQAKHVLLIWNDPLLYQQYLGRMLRRWAEGFETRAGLALLSDIYFHYRKLEGVKTPVPMLRRMFDFYYPSDAAGLAEVYRDWHQSWGELDQWGYEKYMKFYATCGDISAVKDLWARYTTRFPEVARQPLGFRSTLNAFAQIGDVAGAEKEFETMTEEYGVRPDIDSWNTLLKCYSKVDDQSRAFRCFEEIRQVDRPDAFTYAQVMAMAAKRGDLATVLQYFDESQRDKIAISREMALSLVLAYCHNGRLEDAEKICVEFSERNATSTVVWNQLLFFNGQRGDLNKCYDLLKSMMKYGVEWDHQTHEFLLRAMVHVDQVQLAYQLLQTARDDGAFPIGPEHFAVVMSGAVRTGQLMLAETIVSQMRYAGFEVPLKAHVSLVQAAVRQTPSSGRSRRLADDLVDHVLGMLVSTKTGAAAAAAAASSASSASSSAAGGTSARRSSRWTAPSGLLELKRQTSEVGRTIMLLVEQRNYAAVEKLVSAYLKAFPGHNESKLFPPEIASALMLGYLQDGKLEGVHKLWKQTFDGAVASNTPLDSGSGIYPAHQHDLARPLDVVIKAFGEARDGAGLRQTVEQVLDHGFKLTRTNWNLAIRHLAELGHWERAMEWCEQMLMPNWPGWTPKAPRPSTQERRGMKSNRVLVASKTTVLSLQKEWLRLRKLAAWSGGVSSQLKHIEERHPKLHYAFITTDYQHLVATWVLPRTKSMTKAIKELLRPLSHEELKAMRNALERQLRLEKHDPRRSRLDSPFHVVVRRGGSGGGGSSMNVQGRDIPDEQIITRAMNQRESKTLDIMLRERQGTICPV
ncbi:hypothetical protein E4U43_001358 [Claviceps pusilla]|uniref:CoxI translation protein CYA5 n=1 Tax=Claviceps pusilla TaxID=123648 RepID=A0A9P7NAC9_9HYPO|nr:hypothetical protein E4U43_001358 [Claviceps pusilla]